MEGKYTSKSRIRTLRVCISRRVVGSIKEEVWERR